MMKLPAWLAAATLGAAALSLSSIPAAPSIVAIPLAELVARSETVIVGMISSRNETSVVAEPFAALKGVPSSRMHISFTDMGVCDLEPPDVGEVGVFFLTTPDSDGASRIAYAGFGRLPLQAQRGILYAEVGSAIELPEGEATVSLAAPRLIDTAGAVAFSRLKTLVLHVADPARDAK